jgi:hypothetical protein
MIREVCGGRFSGCSLWSGATPRVANGLTFAFDTRRKTILLVTDDKSGVSEKLLPRDDLG